MERRTADQAPPPPQVLITLTEDPDTVLLVCPRPECLAVDEICELDQAIRWNTLTWNIDADGLGASVDKNASFHHAGFGCNNCGWEVSLPDWFAADIAWD